MANSKKIYIIGIGDDGLNGLPTTVRQLIERTEILVGDERTLHLIPQGIGSQRRGAERITVGANLDEAIECISATEDKSVAVLASGDPLFYGLARYLCEKLGEERFEVVPHVSSMQLAFARVKESWEEAYLTNLANHPLENVIDKIRVAQKVGLFTTDDCGPGDVAERLLERKMDCFSTYVCENLGSPDERVTRGSLEQIAGQTFASLNVMILVRHPNAPDRPVDAVGRRLFGNPDEAFVQSKPKHGLLTPAEIRSVALAEMDIGEASIVWDVGAGSGSVSVEAAQIAREGTVYAIEMDVIDHQLIEENAQRFGVTNVVAILGHAPEAWQKLPDPDCVFVEGSGREVGRILEMAFQRLRTDGRLVANVGSIENLAEVHRTLSQHSTKVKVWMINLARGTYQLERVRFDALNPTFLLSVNKES